MQVGQALRLKNMTEALREAHFAHGLRERLQASEIVLFGGGLEEQRIRRTQA